MGWSLHGSYSRPVPANLCFSSGCQPPGISSSISEHHTCTTHFNPSAEKTSGPTAARRQTYSSPSRQSSLRSRSSRHTSDRHRPSTRGFRSGKPGILAGGGASHLRGRTHRAIAQLRGVSSCRRLLPRGCQGMNAAADGEAAVGEGKGCSWLSWKQSQGASRFCFKEFFFQGNWTIT